MNLPSIFKNKIDPNIQNSQYTYYGKDERSSDDLNTFPARAHIKTATKSFDATIIGKTDNYIITSDQGVIYIKDCLSIKKL